MTRVTRAITEPGPSVLCLVLAGCALLFLAQSFQAWGWPALDGYPAMERWLDAQFLTADFYTNTTAKFGVDTPQAAFFGVITRLTGVRYDVALAVLTVIRYLVWPFALFAFLRTLGGDRLAALLAVLLGTIGNFALPKMLGWAWLWGDGSTALFAILLALLAWTYFLHRRGWPTLLLMALAALIQPLVAVHGGIVLLLIFAVDYTATERRAALFSPANWAAGVVFLVAFGSQWLLLTPAAGMRLPVAEYLHILAYERHPGDFLPSRFHGQDELAVAIGTQAVAVMAARVWRGLQRRTLIAAVLLTYAAICVAGWLFVEVWPMRLVIDLIPYRTVMMAAPLLLGLIGAFAAEQLRRGGLMALLVLALAFAAAGPVGGRFGAGVVIPAALLLAAGLLGWRLPQRATVLPNWLWGAAALALLGLALPIGWVRRGEMSIPTVATSHPLYGWARTATAPDARFLIEQFASQPDYARSLTPQKMRLLGHRAVVASRDYPFAETDIRPWYRTWVVALDHGRPDRIETADAATLATICRALPYDYVVRATSLPGAVPVVQFAPWHGVATLFVYRGCSATH